MQFSTILITALAASTTTALPLPHLPLGSVADFFENAKRSLTSDTNGLDFMSIAAKNGAQNTQEESNNMMGSTGLCLGSNTECVAGAGQVTK